MAKSRPSVQKRIKEAKTLEKKQSKAARRAAREANRMNRDVEGGIDPDLIGIKPGPQPKPWMDEESSVL